MEQIKKILLVNPMRRIYRVDCIPPLVLGYLAGWVKKYNNVEVRISDEAAGDNVFKDIELFSPDLVGITAMTDFALRAYEIAKFSRNKGILTVIGGQHATVLADEVTEYADIVVKGPGEMALSEIIQGKRDKVVDGKVVDNLDLVPPIPWELLNMRLYSRNYKTNHPFSSVFWPKKLGFIMSSRGCPYSCIFCYNSSKKTKLQFMSPRRLIEDVLDLRNRFNIEALCFVDDNLFSNQRNLNEICDLMIEKKLNIKWMCGATVNYITKEALEKVKKAGCVQISFGFESGSPRVLGLLKKNVFTVEDNLRAIKLCKDAKIRVFGSFIIGTITETELEIRETIDFIRNNSLDSVNLQIAKPYPGTELWNICVKENLIPDNFSWYSYDRTSFCENITYDKLSAFLVEAVNVTNRYTFKRAILRIRHEPLIVLRLFYDKRFWDIFRMIFRNMLFKIGVK